MKISKKIALGGLLLIAVVAVVLGRKHSDATTNVPSPCCSASTSVGAPAVTQQMPSALPRLVDLGAEKCVPCKMMAPILDVLQKEYEGQLVVEFIDVWKNPDAGKQYGIEMIPTQIFYDVNGKELYRHAGFISKDDILKKWNELGVTLSPKKN